MIDGKSPAQGFRNNVALVAAGAALGQGGALLAAPLLTRLYSPEAFGTYGLFTAASGVLAILATAQYDAAIPLAKRESEARRLVWICLLISAAIGGVTAVVLAVAHMVDFPLGPWGDPAMWALPFAIAGMGGLQTLLAAATREGRFRAVAGANVVRSTGTVGIQITLNAISSSAIGLALGQLTSIALTILTLFCGASLGKRAPADEPRAKGAYIATASAYAAFPRYSLPRALLHALSQQLAVVVMGQFFGVSSAGRYWLAYRTLGLPSVVLGEALRTGLMGRARQLGRRECTQASLALLAIGIVPAAIMITFGPTIFNIVFGATWDHAGRYAQWLTPALFVELIAVPAAVYHIAAGRQRFQANLEIVAFFAKIAGFIIGVWMNSDMFAVASCCIATIVSNVVLIVNTGRLSPVLDMDKRRVGGAD